MSEYNRIVDVLQQNGERLTVQRRWVIKALADTHAHMTISDVNEHIQTKQDLQALAEPTIYRILQWLKDLELVSQTDLAGSGVVYQIIGSSKHHHLICLECGSTMEIDDDLFNSIRENLVNQHGFHARIDHMAIYGYCRDCASEPY